MQCIWNADLDGKFDCTVFRTGECVGVLVIKENDETIFTKDVDISFDAQFGADALDVMDWKNIIVEFIDNEYQG